MKQRRGLSPGRSRFWRQVAGGMLAAWLMPATAAPLKFCFEDVPQTPWTQPDGTGLNFVLLKRVENRLGEQFEFKSLPWKRCLAYVASGEMDGVVAAAYSAQRAVWGVVPLLPNGEERSAARLYYDEFHVYVRSGSPVKWDGKAFANLNGSVAIQAGFVVAERLGKMGVELDQSGKSAEHGLRLLMNGSASVAVLQASQANFLIHGDPRFRGHVEVLPVPFAQVPLHLLMSRKSWQREQKRIEALWDALAIERESADYQKQEKALLQLVK